MMKALTVLALLVALGAADPAGAAPPKIGPAQAAAIAQERFLGEAIDVIPDEAEPGEPPGRVYEVKLLTASGDVLTVRVSAETGQYLGAQGPDLARAQRPAPQRKALP